MCVCVCVCVCFRSELFDFTGSCLLLCFKMVDEVTKKTLAQIPLLKTKAGPRDGEQWIQRLKEEYQSLIQVTLRPDCTASSSHVLVPYVMGTRVCCCVSVYFVCVDMLQIRMSFLVSVCEEQQRIGQ